MTSFLMRTGLMISVICAWTACAGGPGSGPGDQTAQACPPAAVREKACPVSRVPPTYPGAALQLGAEAMVLLEFDVREDGRTDEIEVVHFIGHPEFARAAAEAARQWEYEPAMRDGQPVVSRGLRVAIPFRIRIDRQGMTPRMMKLAKDAFAAINAQDDERLRASLEKIERLDWMNLYEAQHAALLRGILAFREGRLDEALADLTDATSFRWNYIPVKTHAYGLGWRIRAHALAEQPGEAMRSIEWLEHVAQTTPSVQVSPDIERIRSDIEALRETQDAIAREVTISAGDPGVDQTFATYVPLRSAIRVEPLGKTFPSRLRVFCDDDDHMSDPDATPGTTIELDRPGCRLELHGEPGTRARIVELPVS